MSTSTEFPEPPPIGPPDLFGRLIDLIPRIQNGLQWGLAALVVLAIIVLQSSVATPTLAIILVFSCVPMLISMQLASALKKAHRFVVVMTITLMTLAFLGTGLALTI